MFFLIEKHVRYFPSNHWMQIFYILTVALDLLYLLQKVPGQDIWYFFWIANGIAKCFQGVMLANQSNCYDVFTFSILASNVTRKIFKIASKLTRIVTILASITLAGEHIFQVLAQYSWVLPQYLRILSQYLRVLSRWIHP